MSNLKETCKYISHVLESDATDAEKRVARTIMNLLPLEEAVEIEKVRRAGTTCKDWPVGYCLDPNGNMVCPEGQREAWAFGYDIGYQDAFKTLKSAQLKVMIDADAVELESALRGVLDVFDTNDTDIRLGAVANAKAVLAQLDVPQPAAPQSAQSVTDDMVQRFLGWRLPSDFSPDCGISFRRVHSETSPFGPQNYEPTGTNLFTAVQARAMLEHVLEEDLARKPIWTGADEAMFWLNEIEKYQGGSNGPTIKLRAAILAAAPKPAAPQLVPVAWRVHPFDHGIGYEGVYGITMRTDQVEAWKRKGWTVEPLYAAPQPAAPQAEPCEKCYQDGFLAGQQYGRGATRRCRTWPSSWASTWR